MKFMMFTKHLQELPLADAAREMKRIGFDGADLTVRPGGYVDPTFVESKLPSAIATLRDAGLETPLLTTAITSANDPVARRTFEAAAEAGVQDIKLGYWRYKSFGSFTSLIDSVRRDLDGIEEIARETRVRANIHNHSEDHATALAPVVWQLIKDRDPTANGAYFDPGHACVEGGGDGWRMGLDLLSSHISLIAIKDLDWAAIDDRELGKPRWYTRMVPLRRGIVPWPTVFACLRQIGFDGWASLHAEYQGPHAWKDLTTADVLEQTKDDLAYLRETLASPTDKTDAIIRRGP